MDLVQVGWLVTAACALGLAVLVDGARSRHRTPLGPAGRITLLRALLACVVAGLTAHAFVGRDHTALLVVLASVALALDAVDGLVARRTGTASALGARFDMEVDAFLIAVLSVRVAPDVGWWVLAIGAIRYAYVAASWALRWLRRPLPPRYSAKVVAAVQGIVLTVAASGLLPVVVARVVLAVALALLVESFARDVRVLWAGRREPQHAADRATAPSGPLVRPAVVSGAAFVTLWLALVLPDALGDLTPLDLARIPAEGLVLVAAALVLPAPVRRWVAIAFGALVGVLVVLRVLNTGFGLVLDRTFDPLVDWSYLGSAVGVLGDSIGDGWARVVAVGAAVLACGVLVATTLASVRVARAAGEHRRPAARGALALGAVWALCAVTGVHVVGGGPVAAAGAASLAVETVDRVRTDLADQEEFAAEIEADRFGDVPDDRLLAGLRGKDVLLVFVESYGRSATAGSSYAPGVTAVLRDGTARLDAAGYQVRSAFLTSPTFGAASWLAHSSTQSGLWVDSERRYRQLLASDRLTLTSAFERAGWRTVLAAPANTEDWPEGERFYGFDEVYDARDDSYTGPEFGYASMPDQFTLEALRRRELTRTPGGDRQPVMAEVDLVSSHHPWAPPPPLVPWDEVGDGSVFVGTTEDESTIDAAQNPELAQELYGRSIEYSWATLVSFLETYPDPDRVVVVLGDHEPHAYVSGDPDDDAGHDVPVTVITQDPAAARAVVDWQWQPGLLPDDAAPVWPMDALRDRFLAAYATAPDEPRRPPRRTPG